MSALDDLKSMLDVLTDVANTGPKAAAAVKDALSTTGSANPSDLLAAVTSSENPQSLAEAYLDQLKDEISQNEKLNSLMQRRIRLRQEEAKLANAHPATVPTTTTQPKPAAQRRVRGDVVDAAVTSSTPDATKIEITVKAEEPPKVEPTVTAPTSTKPERATPKKETTASTSPAPTEPKVTKRAEPVVTPPPAGGGGKPPRKDPPVAYSAEPEDSNPEENAGQLALTSRAINVSGGRSRLGYRPSGVNNLTQIIKFVRDKGLDTASTNPEGMLTGVLDESTLGALREFQPLIGKYEESMAPGGERSQRAAYAGRIRTLFNRLYPRESSIKKIPEEKQQDALTNVILPYLREISPNAEAEAYFTETPNPASVVNAVKQILQSVVTRTDSGAVPSGQVLSANLPDAAVRQNFSRILSVLKRLIKRPTVDPRSVKSVDTYLAEQETAATVTPELDLADLISGEGAAKMMGMEGPASSGSIAPGSMTGALSSREFVPQFVRGIGIRLYRAIDSWKESLKSGSAIEGLGNSEVFPTGFETTLTTALQQLSEQVNTEIEQGMLETRQIGGNEVTLPKTVAGKLSEIVLDTSKMATHSTLIGRLGNKRGPVGALVTGDPIQKFLNLFLASVMQKLRRGEQITGNDVKNFLTQTVTPDQATDKDGNLINGSVAGESVTVAETMATRLVDSLEYHKQKALTQMVATSDNPVESGVWRNEVIRLTQEQKVLNQLIKKDEDFEDPSQAAEIRGQLLNQGAPFTREQALAYLFGTSAARQEYNDVAYPITDYASKQMTALTAAGVATPTGYFRPNSRMRRLIDYTQKGHTEAAKGQLVPTLDKQIEGIKNAENAFQEKDQILEAVEQAYGIPFVTSLLNASRVTADDSGTILQGQDLIKGLGGSGFAGRRFESIVGFSSGVGSIANFGIDAVDFARLMTNTDLTDEQTEARDQLALKFPELAGLSKDDLKKLAELDLEQNPADLIRKIFRVLGPKIKVKVDALVRQAAKDAGYSDDDATNWLTTGNNVPQGFENLVGAARLFDSSRSTEQQVEINRAVSLAENLVSQYLQSGDTTATALARLTGNTEMMDTLTPKLAEDAVGSVSAGYSVAAKASDIMADQAGRPQSNIYRRTTVAVRNAERVQKEIEAVNEEIRLLEQAKSKTKSKSKLSVIEKDLIAASRRRDSLRLQLQKEQQSFPQDRITKRMEQLRSTVSISPNTVEGARAATELAIREATRKITGRYDIEGDEGFGTDSLENRFARLVEYTDLEELSSRTPEQQRRFDELQAQRSMRRRQYQGEETQDTIFTVWTPDQRVSTEASDVVRGTSLRPLIQNAREVSSDNEEIPVSNFPVDEMVKLAKEVTPEDFAKYGTEYADLKQEAKFLSERIKAFRSMTELRPEQKQQLEADEERIRAVIVRGKELEAVMADPKLLPMNAEEEKESQLIEAETNRIELLLKSLKDKLLSGQISQEEFDKQSGFLNIDKSINNTRRLELGAARRRRTGSNRLGAVKRIVDIVFDSIEQYSSEMTGGAGGVSLDTNQVIGELMTQVRAEGVREAPAGASSATQRIEQELVKVAKDIVTSQNLPDIDASYTDAELKEARDYLVSIRGKDKLTPEETRKRSAMKARLFRQSSTEIATRFKDNKGVLDIADLAVALLPADWQTNDVQADQAYTLAEMLQGLTPIQLAALAKVDITNAYSLAALARNKDPQLSSLAAVISQVNSNTDTSVSSRLAFRKGTQRARQAQNVSGSIAAARANLAEVRGVRDFYFDLETDYSDVDPSKRHIAQAAFTDESGQVDEVFGVASAGQLARLVQLKKTAKDEAEFVALAMGIFNEDADGKQMAQGPSKAVLQKAAEVAYRSQYLTAHVMTQQDIRKMLQQRIKQADRVIGHNIAAFDLPAVYGGTVPTAVSAKVQDTLPMSRSQYIGSHTLSGTYKYVTGQDLSGAHDAAVDVAANKEIFAAMSTMLTPAEVAELRQLQAEEARLSALQLTDAEKKDLKDLETKAASGKLSKKNQARFDKLTARDKESRFGTRLSEEKRQRKRQLEGRPRNDTYTQTLDPALQRLMSFGDPTNDPKAAKEMAAAFAYINPLQQMLDFTSRVDESVASGQALDYGADKKTAEINQRIVKNINTMFKSRLQSAYGVDDVRNLDQTQLADFRSTLQQSFIDPNSGLLMDVVDEKTGQTKKSFYPIKAYLQQMLGGAFPTRGQNSGYAQSVPLLERFGSLSSIMAAAGTLGIQADMGKGVSFPSMGNLLTQMLAGTDTSRQAAMVGTARPRNPAVTSAVRTASVGTGEGGAGFGGGGSGDGGGGNDGDGEGGMGGGFRSITIANATIQSMTANSVGITLQGGSIVLNGQAVELNQRGGGSYGQGSQYFSKNPVLTALSGVTNLLEAARNLAAREMSGQTTIEGKESVRDQAMNDFGQNVAMMFTNNPAFRELTARLSGLSKYGMALPDLGGMADDPLGTLGTLSGFNASLSSTLAERKTELEAAGVLTESQQAELDGINRAEEDLKTFSEVIRRLNSELGRTQAALTVRNSYEKSAGAAAKSASTGVSNVSGRRDRFSQASLQAARNVFDQSMGSAGGLYGFQGRAELTRATSDYVLQMMKSSGSVESVIDPATGQDTIKSTLGFDPAVVGSGVDVSGLNAAVDEITQELKQFATSTNIESTMASFSRLNASLQVARDSLIKMANDDTLDPDVREQAATQLKVLDDATYASSEGGRELEKTERALTSQRSKQIQTLRERLQANATENLAFGPLDFRRGLRERRMISDFLKSTVNDQGYRELFGTGRLTAISAKNPKNRIDLKDASYDDILATSQRLSEVGSEMSVESLQGLQRAVNESQQQRNQSPYSQSFNWLMNQGRNFQTLGMYGQSLFNLPQTLTSMVQQFAEPKLNTVRTLTSARALSLDASKYSQVLGAASNLQQRFGGTITGQLGQITSFIPLTNTYGVDIDEVVNVARKLAAFDPAQGMEGASIAIKEFLSGNVASLSRRFELNRSSLTKINAGDPQKMLDSLNDLLNGMGITDRLIDEQANSLATKYDKMLGKLDQVYINLSSIAVDQITPYLDQLTNGTDGGFLGIDLSGFARDKVFETMSREQAAGAADEALIGPNGLDSINLSDDTAKFAKSVDTVLREANKAMGGVSETYNTVLGTPAQFDAYKLLGNMTGAERVRIQAAAQKNVGAGMTTSQAILQALRDVGGDYNQNQALMGFRRQLGFYDGVALDAQQQENLVRTLGQSNFEGWSELTRNFDTVEVLDADTVRVTVKDKDGRERQEDLRFAGIDAFERGTPESDAAIAYVRQVLSNAKNISVSSAGLDRYGRTVSMINVDGVNLNADLIRKGMASAGYMDMEGTAFTPEMRAQFEQLQLAAGNAGVGPINKDAAEMGLGALPVLSAQAKENVFQQQYGLGNLFGTGVGAASGFGLASIVTKLALAGGFTMPAALAPAGASFGGALTASLTNPAFWVPILAGAVVGGGAYAYTNAKNREAYNADSSLETVKAQYQEQLKLDQEAMNETRANRYAQFYKYEITDEDRRSTLNARVEAQQMPYPFTIDPNNFSIASVTDEEVAEEEAKILKAAATKASEEYTNYYNSMTEQQKEVEKMFKINPFSGERERISAIRNQIDTYTVASKESRLAADMLNTYSESITEFTDSTTLLTNNIDTFNNAIASGMQVRIPAIDNEGKLEKVKLTEDVIGSVGADTLRSILDQIPQVRMSTYQQEAKNYLDQSMEQQLQLRQTRLQNRMDSIGKLSLTAAPLRAATLTGAGTPSYASGAEMGSYYTDMLQGVPTYSEEAILKLLFNVELEEGKAKSDILDAARQAMKLAQDQLKTFQEQEMLTYMVDLQYGTTMKNFVTAFNMNPKASMDYLSLLGQGNPRFAFDYTDQMMGINPKQMFMQGFTPNMPPIRSAGPGAVSFGYTQGPIGQLQMYSDMARSSSMFDMLNMGEQMQIYQGMAQAQGQITMRNIQYGNQMRDLTINHNRTMEDIARNSARQIEGIHRNFAREMKLNQQTNEVNKRAAPPATYERMINASAKIPAEERKRIDQEYVNDRNEANRLGVFNYEMFMKEFQNEDPELAALVTEYQAIDPTDYAAREDFFQNRLRPRVGQLLPMVEQRWETAEGPEKERLGKLITALSADPQRADRFLQAADTKANESLRRAEVKADAERQLKDLKLSEEQIRNQIADQEKNIREKGPTMTETERRDADLQLRMSKNELANNQAAQAAANAQIEGVTSTLPLYQDSVKETWNSIVMDSTTALAQLRTNLNEYQITLKQQIEDAELQLGRSKADVVRQFKDAAVEISQTVPEEFKKGLDAIMTYNSARTQAEILYMSAQNYDTSTPEGAEAAANTLANARLVMANGTRAAFGSMGYSEADMNQLVAASTAPYSSVVGRATTEPGNKAARLSEFETGLSKYASPYNRNALQVVIVEAKPMEVPGGTGGNNQEDPSKNGVVQWGK